MHTPNPAPVPSGTQDAALARPAVMSVALPDRTALQAAYMPFLKNGGIFLTSQRRCQLGDDVYLLLSLLQDDTRYPVAGKVAWITPAGTARHQPQGLGVQFPADEAGRRLRQRIEELLGTTLGSARPTHTL